MPLQSQFGPVPLHVWSQRGAHTITTRHGDIDMVTTTAVMGVLNVTADSFSDGGRYLDPERAVARGLEMARQGAAIIDVGGESTRPGAMLVPLSEEIKRVVPVIRGLRRHVDVPISIDTQKAEVARQAFAVGADMVNDVSALRFDPEMACLLAREEVPVVLMHMQGEPGTMQDQPRYVDVVREVKAFLGERVTFAISSGIRENAIVVDPGIGFGKTLNHNLELLRSIPELASLNRPLLVGLSRKSFIGRLLDVGPDERLEGSLAAAVVAAVGGAQMLRVHDVLETCRALRLVDSIRELDHATT
jgi:dihydropteroate synthase